MGIEKERVEVVADVIVRQDESFGEDAVTTWEYFVEAASPAACVLAQTMTL